MNDGNGGSFAEINNSDKSAPKIPLLNPEAEKNANLFVSSNHIDKKSDPVDDDDKSVSAASSYMKLKVEVNQVATEKYNQTTDLKWAEPKMERSGRRAPIMKNNRMGGHSTLFDGHDTKVSFKSADARMPEVY